MKGIWMVVLALVALAVLAWKPKAVSQEPSTGRVYTPEEMAKGGLSPTGGLMTEAEALAAYNSGQIDYQTYWGILGQWGID